MNAEANNLREARSRIAACFEGRDEQGRLVQCRDALNLAGLGLTAEEIEARFTVPDRGLGEIGFGDLVFLRYLDLTSNHLERLPRGVERFDRLVWLGLNFNQITSLTAGAGRWPELKRLYLRGNKLVTLPEVSAEWESLEELDLFGNEPLESLPHAAVRKVMERLSRAGSLEVVIAGTDVWERSQKAGIKAESDGRITREILEWLLEQPHRPEAQPDPKLEAFDTLAWLLPKVEGDRGLSVAKAMARLGLENSEWFSALESPEAMYQKEWFSAMRVQLDRAMGEGAADLPDTGVWCAWYGSRLHQHLLALQRQRKQFNALQNEVDEAMDSGADAVREAAKTSTGKARRA